MDNTTLALATLAITQAGVSLHAWRLGNEKRDVALLGAMSALCGVGTIASAVV
jgi:hypothetical protein